MVDTLPWFGVPPLGGLTPAFAKAPPKGGTTNLLSGGDTLGKRMENDANFRSCILAVKDTPAYRVKARKAIFWLYVLTAVGILLPLVLFAVFG